MFQMVAKIKNVTFMLFVKAMVQPKDVAFVRNLAWIKR